MPKLMVVMIKGPNRQRGWLVPAADDDTSGAVAYFVQEDPNEPYEALRTKLKLGLDDPVPIMIEVQVNTNYFNRLRGQVVWRE